jgi:hypothetical protein
MVINIIRNAVLISGGNGCRGHKQETGRNIISNNCPFRQQAEDFTEW